jgi:hypothetical protein
MDMQNILDSFPDCAVIRIERKPSRKGFNKEMTTSDIETIVDQIISLSKTMNECFGIRITLTDAEDTEDTEDTEKANNNSNQLQAELNPNPKYCPSSTNGPCSYSAQAQPSEPYLFGNKIHANDDRQPLYRLERVTLEPTQLQERRDLETIYIRVGNYKDIIHVIPVPNRDSMKDDYSFALSFPKNMQADPSEVIMSFEQLFPGFSVVEYAMQKHTKQSA